MIDMVGHVKTLEALAAECDWCTEFGVRRPDDTSSTMSLLRGVRKGLASYDKDWCGCREPEEYARRTGKQFTFHQEDSLKANIEPTELLMIDTLHTYSQLRDELARHHSKVSRYIVMHDTNLFGQIGEDFKEPGLQGAIDEFLREHSEWSFHSYNPECCGLTILERKL